MYTCSVAQLCLTPCDPVDYSLPGSSVHGILQARILKWVAISFSRGSSWPRDQSSVSYIGRWILYRLSHLGSPYSALPAFIHLFSTHTEAQLCALVQYAVAKKTGMVMDFNQNHPTNVYLQTMIKAVKQKYRAFRLGEDLSLSFYETLNFISNQWIQITMRFHIPVWLSNIEKLCSSKHWKEHRSLCAAFMCCWSACKQVKPLWKTISYYLVKLYVHLWRNLAFLLLSVKLPW